MRPKKMKIESWNSKIRMNLKFNLYCKIKKMLMRKIMMRKKRKEKRKM